MTKESIIKTLKLNKWLLVETEEPYYQTVSESGVFIQDPNSHESELIEGRYKFLCTGDQFEKDQKQTTEKGCVLGQIFTKIGFDAFVGEIEQTGFYWGENPFPKPPNNDLNGSFLTMMQNFHKEMEYDEAESRTFNPEKTRIYEILG